MLLGAESSNQIPIIEKALKFVGLFVREDDEVKTAKNDIIARAILDILSSGRSSSQIRDQIFSILSTYHTTDLNLETEIFQPGYTRSLKQCLLIDETGKIREMELLTNFMQSFLSESVELMLPDGTFKYGLKDLADALDFALISEGALNSDKIFDQNNVLKVRLHTLLNGDYAKYFECDKYVSRDDYIKGLLTAPNGRKAQIINFNINYVDDRMAKVITKILSKMLFDIASTTIPRGSRAFHIIIEEAHRYVIKDRDADLLGYNIFERITKEGRKYGIFLGLITQRPSELSDTCISQCTNFIILRILHPKDLEYIKNMVPNISAEIVQQLKNLKPGNCIAFGNAFKVPISMYVDLPDPRPMSNNVDLKYVWYHVNNEAKSELNDPFTSNIRDISTIPKNDFM